MSSPETESARTTPRGVDPVTARTEELIAALGADPVSGLSPKEAERRLAKHPTTPLFSAPPRSFSDCLRQALREPAFWMLLAVSVVALFFDRILLGAVCALLTAGNAILCAYFLYRTELIEASMAVYDTPLCRVLRDRRVHRLPADRLVAGDIILLYPGDIVPADCRLLRADGLILMERELDATAASSPPHRLRKDAEAPPRVEGSPRVSPSNMAFAGGVVEEGNALALVTAVGGNTHLGGMKGVLPSANRASTPASFRRAARVLSLLNLGLFCLSVPLTVLGIFTLGDTYEFLDIFLSALSLSTLLLTEHTLAKACFAAASVRRAAALDRDKASTAEIRSTAVCERLTNVTDILLVGTAALHDGLSHPKTLRMGESLYRCDRPESDDEARFVAEYLYLYYRATRSLPSLGGAQEAAPRYIPELCDWAELDTDSLLARVSDLRTVEEGGVEVTFAAEGPLRLRLTELFREVESCDRMYTPAGYIPVDGDLCGRLYRSCRESIRKGSRVAFLITESKGLRTLRATLTYATHSDRRAASCVRGLEKAGIRVAALLREDSHAGARALSACGLTDETNADSPPAEGVRVPAARRMEEGCRAFVGCDGDYILACIRDLKAAGRTVGILATEGRDLSLLAEADVAFTCTPSLYNAAESHARKPVAGDADPDGLPDGRIADDRTRRTAHVLVRRSSADGGGILGIRHALLAADRCRDTLERCLRLMLLSQTARIVMTLLPLCMGLTLAAAPVLLLSGLGLELLFMAAYAGIPLGDLPSPRRTDTVTLRSLWRTHRAELIAAASGAAAPWLAVGIASPAGASFGGDLVYVGLLCTVALQLLLFRTAPLPRRNRRVFLVTLAGAPVYVGALGAALAAGLSPVWVFLIPPVAPAVYLLLRLILRRALPVGKGKARTAPEA